MRTISTVQCLWDDRSVCRRFRTGVSLHSHTLHSRESFNFLVRLRAKAPLLEWLMSREEKRRRPDGFRRIDYSRAWWTPPLSARAAWEHEREQIENGLGLRPLVAVTDHDNIEACWLLRLVEDSAGTPISVEWTAPVENSVLHLGVHNLPPARASELIARMNACTLRQGGDSLADLLATVTEAPEALVVLNHPLWDERGIGFPAHRLLVERFLDQNRGHVHALELNGWRPWWQNRAVMDLSRATGLPLVSGGDRHALEPASLLNLTHARTFEEFVEEVRDGRSSHVLFLPPYREPRKLRIIETLGQILAEHPHHGAGWTRWSDRIFCQAADGTVASLTQLWGSRQPGAVKRFAGLMRLLGRQPLRPALRFALAEKEEALP